MDSDVFQTRLQDLAPPLSAGIFCRPRSLAVVRVQTKLHSQLLPFLLCWVHRRRSTPGQTTSWAWVNHLRLWSRWCYAGNGRRNRSTIARQICTTRCALVWNHCRDLCIRPLNIRPAARYVGDVRPTHHGKQPHGENAEWKPDHFNGFENCGFSWRAFNVTL